MIRAILPFGFAIALAAAGEVGQAVPPARQAKAPAPGRAAVLAVEKKIDARLSHSIPEPMEVLGETRGVYLQGYGTVFTTQVNLIVSPGLSPFRQSMSTEEKEGVHKRKLKQLPVLKQAMREMLLHSAQALDSMPLNEHIVVGVNLFYFMSWEDTSGLPSQIVMSAERGRLLKADAAESIRTEEY